jgi:hypothetical protein
MQHLANVIGVVFFILVGTSIPTVPAQEPTPDSLREAHVLLSAAARLMATESMELNLPAAKTVLFDRLVSAGQADAATLLANYVDAVKASMSPMLVGGTVYYSLTYNVSLETFVSVAPRLGVACNDSPSGEDTKCIAKFFAVNVNTRSPTTHSSP